MISHTKNTMTDELRELIDNFNVSSTPLALVLREASEPFAAACDRVGRSWSGSFAGWHGRMYFRDYQSPSVYDQFSGEWGGINGVPDGWIEREPEEVAQAIEALAGMKVPLKELETKTKEYRKLAERLKADVESVVLSADLKDRTAADKKLVEQIQAFELGVTAGEYVRAHMPSQLMSRDMEALRQGKYLPAWLYYRAIAAEAKSLPECVGLFEDLVGRLIRQRTRGVGQVRVGGLSALHPEIVAKCEALFQAATYPEAVEKGFKVVRDRLRALTGYETGSESFGKGRLYVRGAAAPNVDVDFNEAVKFLTMAIDRFRNEKSHTSVANINEAQKAYEYLSLSSLAMRLLDKAEVKP